MKKVVSGPFFFRTVTRVPKQSLICSKELIHITGFGVFKAIMDTIVITNISHQGHHGQNGHHLITVITDTKNFAVIKVIMDITNITDHSNNAITDITVSMPSS
jgi:hypothetical protein